MRIVHLLSAAALLVAGAPAHAQDPGALAAARADADRGQSLMQEQRWDEAVAALEAAARVMVAEQGAQLPESLTVLLFYAQALEEAERFSDALMMARQIKDHAGAARRFTAFLLAVEQEARLQWVLGDPASALAIYQLLLPFAEGRPDEYADRIPGYRLLEAAMLVELDRFDEAEPRLLELMDAPNRQIAGAAASTYAMLLADRGEYDQATTVFAGVIGSYQPSDGGPDAVLMEALSNLGATLVAAGRADEADALASRVLSELTASGQANSWTAGEALRVRAAAAYTLGQLDLASNQLAQATDILSARLGADHPQTLLSRASLALLQAEAGDIETAQETMQAVISSASQSLQPDGTPFALIQTSIGHAAWRSGDARSAAVLLAAGQETLGRGLGPAHPSTVSARARLAQVLLSPGRLAPREALEVIRQVTHRAGAETEGERRSRLSARLPAPGYLHVEAAWAVAGED